MIKRLGKLYRTSPERLVNGLRRRWQKNRTPKRVDGVPQRLDADYFAARDPWIQKAIAGIERGRALEEVLQEVPGRSYDERVVEYPAFAAWLLSHPRGLDLLDIGCVINNRVARGLVLRHCDRIWFLNPASESLELFSERVFYHLSPLASAFSKGERFPLISCLSTLEHVGYDNSHYGVKAPARHEVPCDEPWVESLRHVARLLAPGGSLLVSVPFGKRELVAHPLTGRFSSQVFDASSIRTGVSALRESGVVATFEVYAAQEQGWEKVDPDQYDGRYAYGVPAASAVALLRGLAHTP